MSATFALALACPASVSAESVQFFDDPEPIAFSVDPATGMPSFAKEGDYEGGKLGLVPVMAYVAPEVGGCGVARKSGHDFVEDRSCPGVVPFGGLRVASAYTDLPRTGPTGSPKPPTFGGPVPPFGGPGGSPDPDGDPDGDPERETFSSSVPDDLAPVPLPASWLMLLAAFGVYPALKRRRS